MIIRTMYGHRVGIVFTSRLINVDKKAKEKYSHLDFIITIGDNKIEYYSINENANAENFASIFGGSGNSEIATSDISTYDKEVYINSIFKLNRG